MRTAAEGASEEALTADLIATRPRVGRHPEALEEARRRRRASTRSHELTVRVVRDLFTDEEFKVARDGLAARLREGP